MNLGRHYKRAKWEAVIILMGLVLWILIFLQGCAFLPTLTHPRSRDVQSDGPDTAQKWDEGYNFGTGAAGSGKRVPAAFKGAILSRSKSRFGYHNFHLYRDLVIYGEKPCSDAGGFDVGIKCTKEF